MNILKLGSKGPEVELLQSLLKKMGFYKGNIDGNFGPSTRQAVIAFQLSVGISADGIVGPNTWNALMPYINGYTLYTIRQGDNFYSIAINFGTTVNSLIVANPNVDYNNLQIGEQIILPFGNIVPTDISYTTDILDVNVNSFRIVYPFLETGTIGITALNQPIRYIKFGNGKKEVLYVGATHANEWITSPLLMKFLETLSKAYVNNLKVFGIDARELFENVSLYVVPMLNPDGVNLVTGKIAEGSLGYNRAKAIAANFPKISFPSGWKANLEGVDINLQFPAGWAQAKEIKYAQGFDKPAPRDFVGYAPLTAREAVSIYNFIMSRNFSLMLTYHTQGEVIYWQFQNYAPANSLDIANKFASTSGYTVADTPFESSFAGLKDWFVYYYRLPGFTIEAGRGTNPLPISQFNDIYNKNLGILVNGMLQ